MTRAGPFLWKPCCATRLRPIAAGRQREPGSKQGRQGSKASTRIATQPECARSGVRRSAFQFFQKRLSSLLQTLLETPGTVAIAAGPRFAAIPIAAMLAAMRVL